MIVCEWPILLTINAYIHALLVTQSAFTGSIIEFAFLVFHFPFPHPSDTHPPADMNASIASSVQTHSAAATPSLSMHTEAGIFNGGYDLHERGQNPDRFPGAYTERMMLGPCGPSEVPDPKQSEAVDPDEPYPTGPVERCLHLMMNEDGRALQLPHHTVGGYDFFGRVYLVALLYDEDSGSTWYSDVKSSDVDAVVTMLKARAQADLRAQQAAKEAGIFVYSM